MTAPIKVGCAFLALAPLVILAVLVSGLVGLALAVIFMLLIFAIVLDTNDY